MRTSMSYIYGMVSAQRLFATHEGADGTRERVAGTAPR